MTLYYLSKLQNTKNEENRTGIYLYQNTQSGRNQERASGYCSWIRTPVLTIACYFLIKNNNLCNLYTFPPPTYTMLSQFQCQFYGIYVSPAAEDNHLCGQSLWLLKCVLIYRIITSVYH